MTPPAVAKQLAVAAETVIAWIRSGELRGFNVGSGAHKPRYRISREALAAFIRGRQVETPQLGRRRVLPTV